MPPIEELWRLGGAAGVMAAVVVFLYKRQTSISDSRLESWRKVVERLEEKLESREKRIEELHQKIEDLLSRD